MENNRWKKSALYPEQSKVASSLIKNLIFFSLLMKFPLVGVLRS